MLESKDELERLIDEELRRYVAVEPPLGMQSRVLAALEDQRRGPRWRALWLVAVPAAVMLAIVIGLSLQPKSVSPQNASQNASRNGRPEPVVPAFSAMPPQIAVRTPERRARPRTVAQVARSDSRLGIFPSPAPPSQQELLLARLARNHALTQTVATRVTESTQPIVISWITIDPVEIKPLSGPDPQQHKD